MAILENETSLSEVVDKPRLVVVRRIGSIEELATAIHSQLCRRAHHTHGCRFFLEIVDDEVNWAAPDRQKYLRKAKEAEALVSLELALELVNIIY